MKILRTALLLVLATTLTGSANQGASPSAADAWIAEPAAGATTAVAFATITNPTAYDVYVTSATSSAAEKVELREGGGAAEKVVTNITVAAYASTELKAGEAHLVLVGLKRPLKTGDTVDLTLMTDGGVKLALSAPVKRP